MAHKLFEYAAIFNPTAKEVKEGIKPEVVVKPTTVLAKNDKEVALVAARAIPESFSAKLDQVEIAFRPF